jgi:catechol 2,3-dioxygenase-like lactoylglutathione lyase family enzyme
MRARIENVTMDCRDSKALGAFWAAVLGYEIVVDQPDDWMVLRDPAGTSPNIGLQVVPEPKVVKNRVHLDLLPAEGGLDAELARLKGLGATAVRYVVNDPDESHWIMQDPEGNEFCLVRPEWEERQLRETDAAEGRGPITGLIAPGGER